MQQRINMARVSYKGQPAWCIVEGEQAYALEGDRFAGPRKGAALGPVSALKLLAPIEPHNKVLGLIDNYNLRFAIAGAENAPPPGKNGRDGPGYFFKPPSAWIGNGDPVLYPRVGEMVLYEAELGLVIGKRCKAVSAEQAADYVLGYTIVNDVSAHKTTTYGNRNYHLIRSKTFDTFCPIGPWISTGVDGDEVDVQAWINGEATDKRNTREMLWKTREIVAWISDGITLMPGDIVSCGAAQLGEMKRGDRMRFELSGIGVLENPVE
jgi:2-keto-4-pentenoate hydratase/2-oxohepta-3-ene-1,7-dioic acid hydratase in catechol pathway